MGDLDKNGVERRMDGRRLIVLETRVEEFQRQMRNHEENNARRFGEIHQKIDKVTTTCAVIQRTNEDQTTTLAGIAKDLHQMRDRQLAADAVSRERVRVVKALPQVAKWLTGLLAGVTALAVAWKTFIEQLLTGRQ